MSIAMSGSQTNSMTTEANPGPLNDELSLLFSRDELREFAADDASAGRNIGKILAALFVYTVLAMSVAIIWTVRTLSQ